MFKKVLFAGALFFSGCNLTQAYENIDLESIDEVIEVPSEFYVNERWLSWTTKFDIETETSKLGTVHRKFQSASTEYALYDPNERMLAKAKMRFFSFGAIFDISDASGNFMGKVEEKIFRFFPTFELYNSTNEVLAYAKMNFWGTKYILTDPVSNEEIGAIYRSSSELNNNNWTVKIRDNTLFKEKKIDPRFFITVMAFQTDLDYWRSLQMSHSSSFDAKLTTQHSLPKTISCANENAKPSSDDYLGSLWAKERKVYRSLFESMHPSEPDFMLIEQLTDQFLALIDQIDMDYPTKQLEAYAACIDLLTSDRLTLSEKCALYTMMNARFLKAR
jgi:uncharacterized protein YxjI